MSEYTDVVRQIADDYLGRLRRELAPIPPAQGEEFVGEIRSHLYEAYQNEPGDSEAARILAVLRRLGEPSELIAEWLPESVVRAGRERQAPLHVLAGVLLALFGVPLGVGGAAFLAGVLATLVFAVATYYVFAGLVLFTAGLLTACAMLLLFAPAMWDKLHAAGVIQLGAWFDQLPQGQQVILLVALAALIAVSGIWLLRGGRRMLRGVRFLLRLGSDWLWRGAARLRRMFVPKRATPRPEWKVAVRRS